MRRTTTLTAAGLISLTLLMPTSASSAGIVADAICAGEPATVVGTGPALNGTEGPDVIVTGAATTVRALGGGDTICVTTPRTAGPMDVDAGTGDDEVLLPVADLAPGSTIAAGEGRDRFVAGHADDLLTLDLKLSRFQVGPDVSTATSFEDAFLMAPEVVIVGDMRDNDLRFHGCQAMLRGGNGDDDLVAVAGGSFFGDYSFGCDASATMWGGPGVDRMRGGHGPDLLDGEGHRDRVEGRGGDDVVRGGQGTDVVFGGKGGDRVKGGHGHDRLHGNDGHDTLIGGAGFDRADGSRGRDRCIAEREQRCER
jgi:Ca2+-binding RTX toxin-like protein